MEKIQSKNLNDESKYGDDMVFESWADNNIFFPISERILEPLHNMGLTPNMVTILSTIFTFLSIYFLHIENRFLAMIAYFSGYLLDCVDGKMARRYKMGSDIGMALDGVSDNISNVVLFIYILVTRKFNIITISSLGILIILSYMLSLSFGLNEAISSYESSGSDNFYEKKKKYFNDKFVPLYEALLYDCYICINKISYDTYKFVFPSYNKLEINEWLKVLKHFGPGNYCLFVSLLLLFI